MKSSQRALLLGLVQLIAQPFLTSKKSEIEDFRKVDEREEFRKVDERLFKQERKMQHPEYGIVQCIYDFPAKFFINPSNNIAYMSGNIQNIRLFSSKYPDLAKVALQEMGKEDSKQTFACSITYDGTYDGTPIVTGNLGINRLNDILRGVTIRIPNEIFLEEVLLRDVNKGDVNSFVKNHKDYVKELEIISDVNLAEKLAEIYKRLNSFRLST